MVPLFMALSPLLLETPQYQHLPFQDQQDGQALALETLEARPSLAGRQPNSSMPLHLRRLPSMF